MVVLKDSLKNSVRKNVGMVGMVKTVLNSVVNVRIELLVSRQMGAASLAVISGMGETNVIMRCPSRVQWFMTRTEWL